MSHKVWTDVSFDVQADFAIPTQSYDFSINPAVLLRKVFHLVSNHKSVIERVHNFRSPIPQVGSIDLCYGVKMFWRVLLFGPVDKPFCVELLVYGKQTLFSAPVYIMMCSFGSVVGIGCQKGFLRLSLYHVVEFAGIGFQVIAWVYGRVVVVVVLDVIVESFGFVDHEFPKLLLERRHFLRGESTGQTTLFSLCCHFGRRVRLRFFFFPTFE
mmetsp:Transcript_802/g.1416  ORF Transcript_802/g.1416 Transcript_802/m.1416 type:complete len:212 (-) Transcript_802:124-759(-)